MIPVQITGIGWVTASGMGCAKERDSFAMQNGRLPDIKVESVFSAPYPYFRRMDAYSRLGLVAVALALKDANLDRWTEKRNIGIIVSTEYGCLHTDMDYFKTVTSQNGIGASPALFSYTLPSTFLGEAAIRFGLTGATFVINAPGPLGRACLGLALESMAAGEADKMLCGVCDLNTPPLPGLDKNLSPGAVFLLLEKFPEKKACAYGPVHLDRTGRIFLGRTEIEDITALVQKCMEAA
ncbi:MAG: beta-ketoacyl synthase N-terminal-like domain-containing protein [Desulfobacterales bacterium]|nr:beta-ketoacyl synthase N-terminal-like domain-containing protein [Desulfobacterales bacterium]